MLRKIRLVPPYEDILKFLPFEDEEAVSPRLFEYHQNAHQLRERLRMALSDNLVLAVVSQLDIRKLADIELPVFNLLIAFTCTARWPPEPEAIMS